jgi:hypothetical protein
VPPEGGTPVRMPRPTARHRRTAPPAPYVRKHPTYSAYSAGPEDRARRQNRRAIATRRREARPGRRRQPVSRIPGAWWREPKPGERPMSGKRPPKRQNRPTFRHYHCQCRYHHYYWHRQCRRRWPGRRRVPTAAEVWTAEVRTATARTASPPEEPGAVRPAWPVPRSARSAVWPGERRASRVGPPGRGSRRGHSCAAPAAHRSPGPIRRERPPAARARGVRARRRVPLGRRAGP